MSVTDPITLPADAMNFIIKGDLDIFTGPQSPSDAGMGNGTVYIRNGGLYTAGLTNLHETVINTNSSKFDVIGDGAVSIIPSSTVTISGQGNSAFTTSAGTLTLGTTGTPGTNNVILSSSAGIANSTDALLINTTSPDGQLTLLSQSTSSTQYAVNIQAVDDPDTPTTGGAINISSAGPSVAGVLSSVNIEATDAAGQVLITSAGTGSATTPAIKLITTADDGNISISTEGATAPINLTTAEGGIFADAQAGVVSLSSANITPGVDNIFLNSTGIGGIHVQSDGTTVDNKITIEAINTAGGAGDLGGAGGNIEIFANGNADPAIHLYAKSDQGKVMIHAHHDQDTDSAIDLLADGTTGGRMSFIANGGVSADGTIPSMHFLTPSTNSKIRMQSAGNDPVNAIGVYAPSGGIDIMTGAGAGTTPGTGLGISIGDAGINIGTGGSVPITIGSSTSETIISGDLTVQGTTTAINTETLTVDDNMIIVNAGLGELGQDSGMLVKRYQSTGVGDVTTIGASTDPVQEFGVITATVTATTVQLATFASDIAGFYDGWWIVVDGQTRKIKSYAADHTATIYDTSDSTATPPVPEGLDFVDAPYPVAGASYTLFSASYVGSFYNESKDRWAIATSAAAPDPLSAAGASTVAIQQYQDIAVGGVSVEPKIYQNVSLSTAGAPSRTITFKIMNHGLIDGDRVRVDNVSEITPAPGLDAGLYVVDVTDKDTFNVTKSGGSNVTANVGASATVSIVKSSYIMVNDIRPYDTDVGISIPGVSQFENVVIPAGTSWPTTVPLTETTESVGAYTILASDIVNSNPDVVTPGATAIFFCSSSRIGGSVSRAASSKSAETSGHRVDMVWPEGGKPSIYHTVPATADVTYRIRVQSAL